MADFSESLTFRHGATVANRFVQPPMLTNSGKDGFATDDTINYWQARSQAGGLLVTEYTYVSENGGPAMTWKRGREQLAAYDDKFIPQLARVAKAMKSHGSKALMQIAHTGNQANYRAMTNRPVYGPSAIDFSFLPYKVHELSDEQIRQIIKDFGAATERAIKAGFDGVEIHGANHYLIQQFVSANTNQRTDHWGGSVEKRFNFPLEVTREVMRVVREKAPADFIVGYRISPEEIHGQFVGYTWHEATKLVDRLTSENELDYVHLSMPHYDAKPGDAMLADNGADDRRYKDEAQPLAKLFQPYLNGAKEIIVGDIHDRQSATAALAMSDLIAVGRENLIDPLFAQKLMDGKDEEIITEATVDQVQKTHLTRGLIDTYSGPEAAIPLSGAANLKPLREGFGGWMEMNYPENDEMK